MKTFFVASTIRPASSMAPGMPPAAGVRTSSAPSALTTLRRSTLIDSGMTSMHLYPRAAQTNASAIPVLPLVGSTTRVSREIFPWRSAAWIIARPMRSFTDASGLKASTLHNTAARERMILRIRTRGVRPIVVVTSSWMVAIVVLSLQSPRGAS